MVGILLVLLGGALFGVGMAISAGTREGDAEIGKTTASVFGSIKQSLANTGDAIAGRREKTPRDLIGWSLSAAGAVIGVVGLLI
jgi:hypothetical protein